MADVEKSAVLKVEVDFGDLEKNQAEISSRINDIRNDMLKLDPAVKENQKTFKENAATLRTLEQQQKLNQKAINELTAAEKASTDTSNFANNSIKQNRELLKELNAEYIRIQKPTKDQTDRLKNLTDTLKSQESAIGDNRRNVGNYAESLKGALSDGLKSALGGIKGLNAGLAASPIGLITQGIQLLTGAFGGLEPIVDFVEQKIAALTAGFKAIVGAIGGFIGALSSGASITEAYGKNVEGLGNKMAQAAIDANNLTKAQQDLDDAEAEALVTTAKNTAEVNKYIISAKDRTKTDKERLELLEQAGKIEKENFNIELANALRRESIAQKELALAIRSGEDRGEALRKANQATADRITLEGQSQVLLERIQVRRNALIQEEASARAQAAEKRQAQIDKANAAEEKRLADLKKRAEEAIKFFNETTNAEFEFTKQATELFYAEQDARLREQLATRQITLEEFNEQVEVNKAEQLEAELQALIDYSATVSGLEDDIAKKKIEISNFASDKAIENIKREDVAAKKQYDDQKKALADKQKSLNAFTENVTANVTTSLLAQGNFLKNFQKALVGTLLDILERQVTASVVAQSLTTPDSILTFGASGIARSAVLLGLVKGAFSVARGAIAGFAEGGIVGYDSGGIINDGVAIRRANGDNRLITAKTGEVVLTETQQMAIGGAPVLAAAGVPGFATGGGVTPNIGSEISSIRQMSAQQNLVDSGTLMAAIRELNISVSVTEIQAVNDRLALQAQVAEL